MRSTPVLLLITLCAAAPVRAQDVAPVPSSVWTTTRTYEEGESCVMFVPPPGLVERVLVDQELRGSPSMPHLRRWFQQVEVAALLSSLETVVDGRRALRVHPSPLYVNGVTRVEGMFAVSTGPQDLQPTEDGFRLDAPVWLEVKGTNYRVELQVTLHLLPGSRGLARAAEVTWRGPVAAAPPQREPDDDAAARTAVQLPFEACAAAFDAGARGLERELDRVAAWCRERAGRDLVIEAHADRVVWWALDDEGWRAPDRAALDRLALGRGEALRAALATRLEPALAARLRVELRSLDAPYEGRAEAHLVVVARATAD